MSIHGITKGRLDRIANHLKQNVTAPTDKRGKHSNRPNRIPEDIIKNIHEHILSFPKYKSHYSRKDNIQHYYLSPLLNVAKLYELYLEKYEHVQYQLMQQKKDINPRIKYEYFRKYFAENFKISFGSPKSDTCQTCDKIINRIAGMPIFFSLQIWQYFFQFACSFIVFFQLLTQMSRSQL